MRGKLPIPMAGLRFGAWVVLRMLPERRRGRKVMWMCRCVCGNERAVHGTSLRIGSSFSCGCMRTAATGRRSRTHRMSESLTYRVWCGAKKRCYNPKEAKYRHYGGRGIKVCERWRTSFPNFLADMGEKPFGKSLDRIDVNGDYEPTNCRWATQQEQVNNRRPFKSVIIPVGTLISDPDGIHRVTLQFPTAQEAMTFFERMRSLTRAIQQPYTNKPATLEVPNGNTTYSA